MTGRPQPLTNLIPAEVEFLRLVRRYGHPAPTGKRVDLQPPVADDGESDCWTHAWTVARSLGATYVEGTCHRAGANGPSMHAWVEQATVFGPQVVECTPGYEDATEYRGIAIDAAPGSLAEQITEDWEIRSSVLQAALAGALHAGVPPERVLMTLATVRA